MNKELLFNLTKKLESEDFTVRFDEESYCIILTDKNSKQEIELARITEIKGKIRATYPVGEGYNSQFQADFYQEKGLDKCWVKDCPNKIYQTENDYKKVRVECKDKHTRMVCLEHAPKLEMEGKCPSCKRELSSPIMGGECLWDNCSNSRGYERQREN